MPTTPLYALPYPAAADPADVPLDMQELAERIEVIMPGRYQGALTPAQFGALTGTQDGDFADLIADAAAGVIWRLRYRAASASAFKWEFVGGSPLLAWVDAAFTSPPDSVYRDCGGPSLTCPRAGDYYVDYGFAAWNGGSTPWSAAMTLKLGAAAAGDAQAIGVSGPSGAGAGFQIPSARKRLLGGRANGEVLAAWGRAAGVTLNLQERWLALTPVRLS